jgi:hypothetical protein
LKEKGRNTDQASPTNPKLAGVKQQRSTSKAKAPNRSFTSCAALSRTNFALVMFSL